MKKALNISILVRRLNVCGGTQRVVVELARKFKEAGHVVTLYTFFYDPEMCYPEIVKDFKVISADQEYIERICRTSAKRGPIAFIRTYLNENRAARNLAQKISRDTDILNPHDPIVYRVAHYYKKLVNRAPSVWVLNDMCTKKASLRRTEQFDDSLHPSLLRRTWYRLFDWLEYNRFIKELNIIAFLDDRDKKWADEEFPQSINVVVRGGLDAEDFPYTPHMRMENKKIFMLAVAILLPHRRFEDAIESVALLRERGYDAELSIVGGVSDESYYKKLRMLVTERGLEDYVHFLGRLGREELLATFSMVDMFIFPCHLQSWGLVVFEAMACGLPVIVSNTAGASEVLVNRKTALIVPPFAPNKIADAAASLYEEPELYATISADGRIFVEQNISWDNYSRSMLELFYRAIDGEKSNN